MNSFIVKSSTLCCLLLFVLADIGEAGAQADLFISELSLSPAIPEQGQPVDVRLGVYNRGTVPAGRFKVEWWAGENYPSPACTWAVENLAARGGRILECRYAGYPSWYSKLVTKAVADPFGSVAETEEANNTRTMTIQVAKPGANGQPNLTIPSIVLSPETPTQGRPVQVNVKVYNAGTAAAGRFQVEWWAGERFPKPACNWRVNGLASGETTLVRCTYNGYKSWYSSLVTKAVADIRNDVAESDERDNVTRMEIRVGKP